MIQEKFSPQAVQQLNDLASFLSFIRTPIIKRFLNLRHHLIGLFCGNQSLKTSSTAYSCVLRIMGMHPVPEKNVDHYVCDCGKKWSGVDVPLDKKCTACEGQVKLFCCPIRVFRFASETLPGETTDEKGQMSTEVKNTQYPEFKKWLPPYLLKKDITARSPKMIVRSQLSGQDIVVEFVSYNQTVQSTAGTQKFLCWCDEQPSQGFYQEQLPRLLAARKYGAGDFILTLTPADFITWAYSEIYARASAYYRSKTISERFGLKEVEIINRDNEIAIIEAATDDNPTLTPDAIESIFGHISDPDVIDIRRYGRFKQVSGRIFKDFEKLHILDEHEWFPEGMPHEGFHARGLDYHQRSPWAIGWAWLSPQDELIIYDELNPSPDKETTESIAKQVAEMHAEYKYRLNLTDPLIKAALLKPNWTVLDDLNAAFMRLKKVNIGTGGYWDVWDTKSERGRDNIKLRLKNAVICGKPFNNSQYKDGRQTNLPTIWVLSKCKNFINSFRNWSWDERPNTGANEGKEEKNTPQARYSHFPMVIEGLLKDPHFRPISGAYWKPRTAGERPDYFKRDRMHA
jgi:hypothetical protein